MKLGLIPEGIIDYIALASGRLPTTLVEAIYGATLCKILVVGTRLGIFDVLIKGGMTADEIANATDCDPKALRTLLNALNGFGLLARRQGRYSNSRKAVKWFTKSSSSSIRDSVLFISVIVEMLENMEQTIKIGKAENFHYLNKSPQFWETYLRGLASFAPISSREIVRKSRLSRKPQRLLDIGGGHGVYSIAFCRKYPELEATVLDLPPAVAQGKKIVAEKGYQDRIRFIEGDLRHVDWGREYDVVLIFNIIHTMSVEEAQQVFTRAYQSLMPGGTIVLLDSEHAGGKGNLSTAAGFGEIMFFVLANAQAYPETTIREWITTAGFTNLRKRKLLTVPMTLFLTAQK